MVFHGTYNYSPVLAIVLALVYHTLIKNEKKNSTQLAEKCDLIFHCICVCQKLGRGIGAVCYFLMSYFVLHDIE